MGLDSCCLWSWKQILSLHHCLTAQAKTWDGRLRKKKNQGKMCNSIGLNLESAEQAKSHKVRWYLSKETTQAKMSYIYTERHYRIKTLPPSHRKTFSAFYAILFPPKWVSIFWSILFLSLACTCKASTKIFPEKLPDLCTKCWESTYKTEPKPTLHSNIPALPRYRKIEVKRNQDTMGRP